MKRIVVLIVSIAINCLTTTIAQNVLDLKDANNPIIIVDRKDTIKANKEDNCFLFTPNDNKPIIIKDIVFANNATEARPAEIFVVDSLLKRWQSVKNNVIDVNFQIKPNSDISIIHGNKMWTLIIKEQAKTEDKRDTEITTSGVNTASEEDVLNTNYITLACVALIAFVVGILIGVNRRHLCKLFQNNRPSEGTTGIIRNETDNAKIEENDGHNITNEMDNRINNRAEAIIQNEENPSKDIVIQSNIDNKADASLDEQIATIIKGYEDEFFNNDNDRDSKIERLQEILSKFYNLLDDKRRLAKEVVNDENANTETLLRKIKALKENTEFKSETSSDIKDSITISEFERIIKANEKINVIYEAISKGSRHDSIKQLFRKINDKIKNSIDPNSVDDRFRAKSFVVDQLKNNGLKDILALLELKSFEDYFLPNTTLNDGLLKIKEDIKKCKLKRKEEDVQTKTDSSSDLNNLLGILKKQLPNFPNKIETVEDLAKVITDLHTSQEHIKPCKETQPNEDAEISIIIDFLAQAGLQVNDKETAISKMKDLLIKDNNLKGICKQYGADNIKELCNAIKEQIYKSIRGILCQNEETKRIVANCHTTEGIVKSLSEAYRNVDSEKRSIEGKQNAVISGLNEAYVNDVEGQPLSCNNLFQLFGAYRKAVLEKIKNEENTISSLNIDISGKQSIIDANNEKFERMLKDMKKKLKCDFDEIQKSILTTFIRPCDQNLKSQCEQNQLLLRNAFEKFLTQLQDAEQADMYEEFYNDVQKIIEKDIFDEHGLTNVLSRYYAYSCLPFMTDRSREYGMRIDHGLMMKAFNALSHFVNQYGLQLIVPNLFADRIDDGEYQDCTGEKYGDLENMCPGVANYVLEISNSDKQHYITDLVQVGYKKGEEIKVKAKVIIAD